jgi:hypothetical protein
VPYSLQNGVSVRELSLIVSLIALSSFDTSAPEGFDVIEGVVSPMQRKNLAEISKMLNQISVGKLFADDNVYLKPLNEYVGYAGVRFAKYFKNGKRYYPLAALSLALSFSLSLSLTFTVLDKVLLIQKDFMNQRS